MMAGPIETSRLPRVTGLTPDPRRPGSIRVQVEGRPLLSVPAEAVTRLGIRIGVPLQRGIEDGLTRAADVESAFRAALRALERRSFARRDLARRLVQRGHPPDAADAALQRASDLGLVDDEKFACHFIETRFARGRGPARLRRELTGLGVAPALVDQLLGQAVPPELARERMTALARKRANQLAGLDPEIRRRRVLAFLARRGYRGPDVIGLVRGLIR